MILFIDTTERGFAVLAIIAKDKLWQIKFEAASKLSETLPAKLQNFFKKNKLTLPEITKIVVVRGHGSFVGTRTGVAWANALAWALNLPILGLAADQIPSDKLQLNKAKFKKGIVAPKYSAPPNITIPKSGRV